VSTDAETPPLTNVYRSTENTFVILTARLRSVLLRLDALGLFRLEDGSVIEPAGGVIVSSTGALVKGFGHAREGEVDDNMYMFGVTYVRDGTLWRSTVHAHTYRHFVVTLEDTETLLANLSECSDEEALRTRAAYALTL
jgi:hypothetical protein